MVSVKVMDKSSPSKPGPGHMTAQDALNKINIAKPAWQVIMNCEPTVTTYSSAVTTVSKTDLRNKVLTQFPVSSHFIVI